MTELSKIQKFLKRARLLDPDMSVQRLMILLEVAIEGKVDQSTLVTRVGQSRAAASKNIAHWSSLTPKKTSGPGYLRSDPDPMNLSSKLITITPKGKAALRELLNDL